MREKCDAIKKIWHSKAYSVRYMFFHPFHIHERVASSAVKANVLSRGVAALALHRLLLNSGLSLLGLFSPIFFYQLLGQRIEFSLLHAAIYYLAVIVTLPLGAFVMNRLGIRRSLILAIAFYACFCLSLLMKGIISAWMVLVGSFVLVLIYHIIYWTPYHTEFAETAPRKKMGEILGGLAAASSFIGLVAPVIAGYTIESFGYSVLLAIVFVFVLVSLFPLFRIKTVREHYSYGYLETYRKLFAPEHRTLLYVYAAEGAEGIVGAILWPIFLFRLFNGSFSQVGLQATAVIAVSILLQVFIGYLVDHKKDQRLLRLGIACSALGWFLKAFVNTFTQVFFVGIYHSFANILLRTPFDTLMYARAFDAGHYVDEYTVLREIALGIGRASMLFVCLLLVSHVGLPAGFILAGCVTFVLNLVTRLPKAYR